MLEKYKIERERTENKVRIIKDMIDGMSVNLNIEWITKHIMNYSSEDMLKEKRVEQRNKKLKRILGNG